jgi:hypothetical protein
MIRPGIRVIVMISKTIEGRSGVHDTPPVSPKRVSDLGIVRFIAVKGVDPQYATEYKTNMLSKVLTAEKNTTGITFVMVFDPCCFCMGTVTGLNLTV